MSGHGSNPIFFNKKKRFNVQNTPFEQILQIVVSEIYHYHINLQIHRKSVVNICKNFVFARLKNAKGHNIAVNTTFKK